MALGAGGSSPTINNGRFFITLKPKSERDVSAFEVIARLRPQLEKVEGARLFMQAAQDVNVGGRASRTQFQYTLQDANLDELSEWAPKVLEKLKTLPMLRDVASDQQISGGALTLTIDRDQAARYGLTPQLIDDTLYDAFGQRQVTQYFTQQNSYHVVMEVLPELQGKVDSLDHIYIRSPTTGEQVPLAAFASWTTRKVEPLSISHQGQFPAVTISFNLAQGASLGTATQAIQDAEREMQAPASLIGTFQGNAQAFQASLRTVPMLILAALFVVYLILGILYESYIHPLTILSTLPSAGAGAIATLMLFGFDFSLVAMIGVILLIGIVKKNGIMLVDFAIHAERNEHLSPTEAVRKAALLRFRPIMMTTAAALLGGVPLMLGAGTGAEIRQPLGYAMVGGLLVSQVLTLYTTPVIYIYLDRLSSYLGSFSSRGTPQAEPAQHTPAAAE
jgi:HAE1 family hydrophobic/amphiphilic exporter-1